MADKIVKITFEIDGLQQSVTNIDDAKEALAQLESQAKQAGNAADNAADDFDKLGDASKDAGEAGEGAISVLDEATGGLASRFKNVITGVGKMGKALKTSFKAGVQGASSLKKAIIATGIGALVVALGLIVAYWDDIKGLVSGVTAEQKKLNAEAEANVKAQQDALDAISAQENSLRLAGKSEDEIRQLKIEQTKEVIKATELSLQNQRATKQAQIDAAERNKNILQGIIRFLTLPLTLLLATVDGLTSALSKIPGIDIGTNLEEGFSGGIASMVFDPEEVEEEADATIAETEAALIRLKNQKDGFILQGQKADKDAADKAAAAKEAEDAKALEAAKAAAEKLAAEEEKARLKKIADAQTVADMLLQADLDLIDSAYERAQAELEIQRQADIEKITAAGATADEIARINQQYANKANKLEQENADFKKQLRAQDVDNALAAGSQILGSIIELLGEGSSAAKAAAQAQNAIDTYASATAAYKSVVGIPVVGPVLAPIAAGVAVAAGIANARKISAIEVPGGDSGAAPNISVPGGAAFNPQEAIQSPEAGNNVVTPEGRTQQDSAQVIKTYVIASEVTSQQEAASKINNLAKL